MKKLLSVLIVAVMLLGMVPFAVAATAPTAITVGQTVTVNVDRSNPVSSLAVTVAEEGEYVFYAEGEDVDTVGTIYDENGEIIADNDDDNDMNFVCTAFIEKGAKLTLESHLYNLSRKGTYTVTFAKCGPATAIVADDVEVYAGSSIILNYSLAPIGSFDEPVTIVAANPEIIVVPEAGNSLFAAKAGTTTLTLSTESGVSTTVNVTVKTPAPLTLNKEVSGTCEKEYSSSRFNFTPATSGYYTFETNSVGYAYAYVTTENTHFSGGEGSNITIPLYMEADKTYTLHFNTYSVGQDYTVIVRDPKPATEIYIDGADDIQYIGFQDWLYAYGDDGEIIGDVEWSVDDPTVADIQKVTATEATIVIRKAGIVTVTAKYGDAEATTVIMGAEIPTVTAGTPYVEETIGMREAIISFTPEKSANYRIKATDELGVDTMIEVSEHGQKENYYDIYMEAGTNYRIRASRFFMGIGFGYDEYDYVGDITVEINELSEATGIKFACGDTFTAYTAVEFEVKALPTNENGAFVGEIIWSISDYEIGEVYWSDFSTDSANVVFYQPGEYTVTAAISETVSKVLKVKIIDPESIVVDKNYTFTVPANATHSFIFAPEKSGMYTAHIDSDEFVMCHFGNYQFSSEDNKFAASFISNDERSVSVINDNDKPVTVSLVVTDTKFSTSMKPVESHLTLSVGEYYYPEFIFNNDGCTEEIASATSSNEKVVTANKWGELFAAAEGTATISFVSDYGLKATITVTVVGDDYDWVNDLEIKEKEITLDAGKSQTLTAIVDSESKKTVLWTSLDDSVARVDANGRVTGISAGKTRIRASVDHIFTYCDVTVNNPKIEDTSKVFKDVKAGKWYTKAIDYAYSYGFIAGTSANEFGRETNVNRGMFITILARIAGVDTGKTANKTTTKFTDVKSGKYYTAAIKWANENGVVSGTSEKTFSPEASISRQDLCVMVTNFAKYMNIEVTASKDEIKFKDAGSISKYAKNAVKTCQMAGIVSGYNDGTFGPKKTATRAEAAQILYVFHSTFIAK